SDPADVCRGLRQSRDGLHCRKPAPGWGVGHLGMARSPGVARLWIFSGRGRENCFSAGVLGQADISSLARPASLDDLLKSTRIPIARLELHLKSCLWPCSRKNIQKTPLAVTNPMARPSSF